jgi:hypothetical protein
MLSNIWDTYTAAQRSTNNLFPQTPPTHNCRKIEPSNKSIAKTRSLENSPPLQGATRKKQVCFHRKGSLSLSHRVLSIVSDDCLNDKTKMLKGRRFRVFGRRVAGAYLMRPSRSILRGATQRSAGSTEEGTPEFASRRASWTRRQRQSLEGTCRLGHRGHFELQVQSASHHSPSSASHISAFGRKHKQARPKE